LAIAPIANSLTPKRIFLPLRLEGSKTPSPPAAFVEAERSAEPPIHLSSLSLRYLIISPEVTRVAVFLSKF